MQTLFWTVVLLVVVLYIAAVILTQQIGHNVEIYGNYRKLSGGWDHEELFGTVGRSMFTLMQVMTLDSWLSKASYGKLPDGNGNTNHPNPKNV